MYIFVIGHAHVKLVILSFPFSWRVISCTCTVPVDVTTHWTWRCPALYRWMWRLTERAGVTGRRAAAESQWSWEASRQTSETPAGSVEVCPDCTMITHVRVSKSWLVGNIPCRKIAQPMFVFWGAQGSHAWLCRQAGAASDRVSIRAIVDKPWVSLITDVMTGSVVTNQLCLSANICS